MLTIAKRPSLGLIRVIANKELKDSLRNRWVLVVFAIFWVLALSMTFAGSAVSGTLALPSLSSVIASLTTVSVFIIPLAAILLSHDAFVGEEEAGTLCLLLTYPVSKSQILVGKLLAHCMVTFTAITSSYGSSAAILMLFGRGEAWEEILSAFGLLIASSCLLATIFILISYLVSLKSAEKARAVGSLLGLWFALVLIYDLLLLALLVADLGYGSQWLVNLLILLNPTDLYRAINLVSAGAPLGSLGLLAQYEWSLPLLLGACVAWPLLLLFWTRRVFITKLV
ncbi:ABC transporter permease subunit [Shewanella sp. Isolate8]|uniref:ABC transporter permease n=1 Tax=Shewanella sp. Isolate8 TaxID=2908529 RepID=UPI001EFE82D2|nr:ABC transporter permease subunit [Shewanella sp. Isolate8]MCG9748022.1 ABC transporter permease [Shewanella sp. Isolate8]